jgi:hypothetical protein
VMRHHLPFNLFYGQLRGRGRLIWDRFTGDRGRDLRRGMHPLASGGCPHLLFDLLNCSNSRL